MRTNYDRLASVLLVIIAAVFLVGWVGYNALAYGDWTCAFTRCVRIFEVKP